MISRKFIIAVIVAIVAPILLLLPWAWGADNVIWPVYVILPILIGIVVGALVYRRIREGCIGAVLSFLVSTIICWILFAFVIIRPSVGDAYPASLGALLFYLILAGVAGIIFGSGDGQSWPGDRQR